MNKTLEMLDFFPGWIGWTSYMKKVYFSYIFVKVSQENTRSNGENSVYYTHIT